MQNKKSAKFTAVFLISALIFISFASCKTGGGNESKNLNGSEKATISENGNGGNTETTEGSKRTLDLPGVKYDGYQFRVMNTASSEMYANTTIVAEEETGEGVNDAVYTRNRLVEDRFEIEIKEILCKRWDISDQAAKSIMVGSDDFDLAMLSLDIGAGIAQQHLLADYNDMQYADLARYYWDRDMVRDLSIGGHNYFVSGDFSLQHYGKTQGVFFNKDILRDLGLESPYGFVTSGKWTYDKFHEMGKSASKDLDGDGEFTDKDQYGFIAFSWVYANAFMMGGGSQMIGKDADDMHIFNVNNEKFIGIYQKLMGIMHDGNMLFDGGDGKMSLEPMFINNQTLFYANNIHLSVNFRGMETDFGILPIPKYDENQSRYYTYVYPPPYMAVPVTSSDLDRTGMILEALCYESPDTVVRAYYDNLLKTKVSRDNESEGMLDMIFQNRIYSITDIYYMPETYAQLYTLSQKKDAGDTIVSWMAKNETVIAAAIEKNNQAFMGDN